MQLMAADVGTRASTCSHRLSARIRLYLFSTENWGFHFVSSALICVHLRRKMAFSIEQGDK
jgi:hypothetical protein